MIGPFLFYLQLPKLQKGFLMKLDPSTSILCSLRMQKQNEQMPHGLPQKRPLKHKKKHQEKKLFFWLLSPLIRFRAGSDMGK